MIAAVVVLFVLCSIGNGQVSKEVYLNGYGENWANLDTSEDRLCYITRLGCITGGNNMCSVDPDFIGGPVWKLDISTDGKFNKNSCFGCGGRCYSMKSENSLTLSSDLIGTETSQIILGRATDRFCYLTRVKYLQSGGSCWLKMYSNTGKDPSPLGNYWTLEKSSGGSYFECAARCVVTTQSAKRKAKRRGLVAGMISSFNVSDEVTLSSTGQKSAWLWPVVSSFCFMSHAKDLTRSGDSCNVHKAVDPASELLYWRLNSTSATTDLICGARCVDFF